MIIASTFLNLPEFVDRHGQKVAAALSAIMVAFFISFLLVVSQVSGAVAQETCSGINLLEHYAKNEPKKLAKLESQAAETLNGNAVFWKVEKPGLKPSWLLGTMHMADPRIARVEGAKLQAFNASQTVIVENIEALDPAQASAALLSHMDKTMYTDGSTLSDRLDAETLEMLKTATSKRGMPFAVVQNMRPWLVATTIALPACELAAKHTGEPVLDSLVAKKAKAEGKQLIGLETIGEQFSAMSALPEEFHLKALRETLKLGKTTEDVMETMKHLYLEGRIGMITPLTKMVSPKTGNSEEYKNFEDSLIVKRNIVMVERSLPHLEKGGAFVAVGALHLPGESGLVNGYRDAGYTVTPIR